MSLPFYFFQIFLLGLWLFSPLLVPLLVLMIVLGQFLGRYENWSRTDALYFTFITSLTIGYGDLRPHRNKSKLLAVAIGVIGLILNGIVVAIALQAINVAFAAWNLRPSEHHSCRFAVTVLEVCGKQPSDATPRSRICDRNVARGRHVRCRCDSAVPL